MLNAPPNGINWEGFDSELAQAFKLQHEATEPLRTLAGKMYQCGVRFAHEFRKQVHLLKARAAVLVGRALLVPPDAELVGRTADDVVLAVAGAVASS